MFIPGLSTLVAAFLLADACMPACALHMTGSSYMEPPAPKLRLSNLAFQYCNLLDSAPAVHAGPAGAAGAESEAEQPDARAGR